MATRAIIGFRNENDTITTTYNHYDGYPSHLGVQLNKFFNSKEKAKSIANEGYISFVREDGTLNQAHNDPARTVPVNDFMQEAKASWADFVYVFEFDQWTCINVYTGDEVILD